VVQVANLFGKQWWRALHEVQFDAFQKQRFFSGKGVSVMVFSLWFEKAFLWVKFMFCETQG